ncbi:MAG: BamA/TamA family outer membrane protein [Pseudomonadota bacterium]
MVGAFASPFGHNAVAQETPPAAAAPEQPASAALAYRAGLTGLEKDLSDAVRPSARLLGTGRDKPEYASSAGLRRAARNDADRLRRALAATGRYAAELTYTVERQPDGYLVRFTAEPGPLFRIVSHRIEYQDAQETDRPETLRAAGVEIARAPDGASLQSNETALIDRLKNSGYPDAVAYGRRAFADFEEGAAEVVYYVETGARARFGPLYFDGLDQVNENFARKYATWEEGAQYELEPVIEFRNNLAATGLFGALQVAPGEVGEDGIAPILVDAVERRRRTIGAGLSFDTDIGPGGRVFFEHRNVAGAAEKVNLEFSATPVQRETRLTIDKPFPKLPGSFIFETGLTEETTDAFDAVRWDVAGGFAQRYLDDRLVARYGVGFEAANIEENGESEQTALVSIPLSVSWLNEDDPLNPTSGQRASFSVTPHTGSETFVTIETRAASRLALGRNAKFVSAMRVRYGAIFGPDTADIPAPNRFYAGGGGSVRGYGFQRVGPLDDQNDPLGGRSVIEAAFEQRVRVWKDLQFAAFVDAGLVSSSSTPEIRIGEQVEADGDVDDGRVLWGAGGGVRYLTPIGPLRLDVAVPVVRRQTDDSFEFYISIGQPF